MIPNFFNWKTHITRAWWGGVIGAVLTVILGLDLRFIYFGADVPVGQGLIHWSYDLLFQFRPDIKTSGAVIVYIDENLHGQL